MQREMILELATLYSDAKPEKVHAANVMLRCPAAALHRSGGSGSPSLSVEVKAGESSRANCFSCALGGSLAFVFATAHERIVSTGTSGLEAAIAFIAEHDQGSLATALAAIKVERERGPQTKNAYGMTPAELQRYVAKSRRMVPRYFAERGFTRGDAEKWGLGLDDFTHPESPRGVFPAWDEAGHIIGTSGRALPRWDAEQGKAVEDRPKYKDWPPAFANVKVDHFYGEHLIDPSLEEVTIVEGPPATIFAGRVIPNVVGVWGASTGVNTKRFAKLRRWAKRIVFMFDGDNAGRDAVNGRLDDWEKWHPGLREELRRWFVCEVAVLPEGKDPADVPSEVVVAAKKHAVYLFDFRSSRR